MKYLEELESGDCFRFEDKYYLKLTDYKKTGERCCISLVSGSMRWIPGESIVNEDQLYTLDKENNIIPLKTTEKQNV